MNEEKYTCNEANAKQIYKWLNTRGGIFIWKSINLSNPCGSWTSPARNGVGSVVEKPNWQCDSTPARHITSVDDVMVSTAKEVKRFHVAVQEGGTGYVVTSGGSRRIRDEISKARQKYDKPAWHVFDYWDEKNAVIMIEDSAIPMAEWVKNNADKLKPQMDIVDGDVKTQEATA